MASIYGPPEHKRRPRRAPEPGTVKTTPMQLFWLVIALIVLVAAMVHLDDGDPEVNETLRRLQTIQQQNLNYRPIDPALFEIPIFEPLQVAEILDPSAFTPAEPAPKPHVQPKRRPPRTAPEQ